MNKNNRYSDNYYQRKCYFQREQVPTQSIMKNKMCPALAKVYFNSMSYKLKILAGLEPPLKGGGNDWYIAPKEILENGEYVLKPIKNEFLKKFGFIGLDFFGEKIVSNYKKVMEKEKNDALLENDEVWKVKVTNYCRELCRRKSKESKLANTAKIKCSLDEFSLIYRTSIKSIEALLVDAAVLEVNIFKERLYRNIQTKFETMLHQQAITQYDKYTKRLAKKKEKIKTRFIKQVKDVRTDFGSRLHDINVEKHTAVEKLRHFLECENVACQAYVASKERQEHEKEMELCKKQYKKKVKDLSEKIALKDLEIQIEQKKETKRQEVNKIWKKKICHIVKKFQSFVAYCLHNLPQYADFFIDMEKLMLLQLNEALEKPSAESLFVPDPVEFHTPEPKPHPFYLFADKGFKPAIDEGLCPKHCTSSATQLPVIVINKRFIYTACDNYDQFEEKVQKFISGQRGDDNDFIDENEELYQHLFPVKTTKSQDILELKLESSLMQILQHEHPNIRNVKTECCICNIPFCFCSQLQASKFSIETQNSDSMPSPVKEVCSYKKFKSRYDELQHERQPKWESFVDYVQSKKCRCAKTAKKHLMEHMPAYMRNMSSYDAPDLPHYEIVPVDVLKRMVHKAQGKKLPHSPQEVLSKCRDIGTQYSDEEFDSICKCFSDDEFEKFLYELGAPHDENNPKNKAVYETISPSHLTQTTKAFVTDQVNSLRKIVDDSPELEEIFKHKDCSTYE